MPTATESPSYLEFLGLAYMERVRGGIGNGQTRGINVVVIDILVCEVWDSHVDTFVDMWSAQLVEMR